MDIQTATILQEGTDDVYLSDNGSELVVGLRG